MSSLLKLTKIYNLGISVSIFFPFPGAPSGHPGKRRVRGAHRHLGILDLSDFIAASLPDKKYNTEEDYKFLEWFIGFVEGDGCFTTNDGRPYLVINQADKAVLNEIRSFLGIGRVSLFTQSGSQYARLMVASEHDIFRVIQLFNGNIFLEKKEARFARFVDAYNQTFNKNIQVKPRRRPSELTLECGWLSGFFDAEGCAYANYSKNAQLRLLPEGQSPRAGSRLIVKATINQKSEFPVLTRIKELLSVRSVGIRNKTKKHYIIEVVSKKSLNILIRYLEEYKLQGRKKHTYAIWKRLVNNFIASLHLQMNPVELKARAERVKASNQIFARQRCVLKVLEAQEYGEEE